jgi:hypothetical protein
MTLYRRPIAVSLGTGARGLAARLRYTLFDGTGTTVLGPTGDRIWESAVTPGIYLADPLFDTRWTGRIEWQVPGTTLRGVDDFGAILGGWRVAAADLGAANARLASTVRLTLSDAQGSPLPLELDGPIQESASLPGVYWCLLFIARDWTGMLRWSIDGRPWVGAADVFGPLIGEATYPPVTLAERPDAPERAS